MNAKNLTDPPDIDANPQVTEAVANLAPSVASTQLGNLRKREFLEYAEANLGEPDRRNRFSAAYRGDDRKFMRFLIPPGKRILELGCGRGHLAAVLRCRH
jgi:hypothetical protein